MALHTCALKSALIPVPGFMKRKPLYRVTRLFTEGILKGLTHTEITSVFFHAGFTCETPIGGSPYRIIIVETLS